MHRPRRLRSLASCAITALVCFAAARADAFPMWARKYQTSCATCHVAIPKLNNFGIAFRNNGYEWPGGEDELTREKPVVMAAEANKEAFPKTLWPSWLPGVVPVSLLLDNTLVVSRAFDGWVSPGSLGANIGIGVGGAIAHGIAAVGEAVLRYDPSKGASVAFGEVFVSFHPFERGYLDVKIGRITPELFSFPTQALFGPYWLYSRTVGGTPFSLDGKQGVEVRSSLARDRLRLVAGTAGSQGDFGNYWDAWGHIEYKIGGITYDGVHEGQEEPTTSADPSKPWRDNSLQVSLFGYHGRTKYTVMDAGNQLMPGPLTLHDEFVHFGGDLNLWWGDMNLVSAFVTGYHTDLTATAHDHWIHLFMAQIDYVVYPWLVPSLRFEYSDDARYLDYSINTPKWHALAGGSFLIRANVRLSVWAEVGPYQAHAFDFLSAKAALRAAF